MNDERTRCESHFVGGGLHYQPRHYKETADHSRTKSRFLAAQADQFAEANREEKIGLLRSE